MNFKFLILLLTSPSLLLLVGPLILLSRVYTAEAAGLKGGHYKCSRAHEGAFIRVQMTNSIEVTCKCENGIVTNCKWQQHESCERSMRGCYYTEGSPDKGVCPRVCKSCDAEESQDYFESFKSGRTWSIPQRANDSCLVKECFSGVVTKSILQCPTPMCENPRPASVSCTCPSCPGCVRGMQRFKEGETKPDIMDPCNECTCKGNRLTCARKACPVLSCPTHLQQTTQGNCCPECIHPQKDQHENDNEDHQKTKENQRRNFCEFRDKFHEIGESFSPDPCTDCHCNKKGTVECHRKVCVNPVCGPAGLAPAPPGSCCPICQKSPFASSSQQSVLALPQMAQALPKSLESAKSVSAKSVSVKSAEPALPAVRKAPSKCFHAGKAYSEAESWTDGCKECVCLKGETRCEVKKCPRLSCPKGTSEVTPKGQCCPECHASEGICTVFGDPHYKTFDGRIFNFQGSCKYLLAKDCGEGSKSINKTKSDFSVRITNDGRDSMAFSWLRTVTVRLDDVKVSLMQRMKVKVNGKRVSLPYIKLGSLSVMKDGYRIVLRTNTGVRLLWDGVSFLELTVPSAYRERMCGLCGNFNGDKSDDFVNKVAYPDGQTFGDTWRVGGYRACSVLPRDMPAHYEPHCTADWEAKIKSDRSCNALLAPHLFGDKCGPLVDPSYYVNACRLDMCECPGEQCHCEVLTAYARECERKGVLIHGWRAQTGCRNVSSFEWKKGQSLFTSTRKDAEDDNETAMELNKVTSYLEEAERKSFMGDQPYSSTSDYQELEDMEESKFEKLPKKTDFDHGRLLLKGEENLEGLISSEFSQQHHRKKTKDRRRNSKNGRRQKSHRQRRRKERRQQRQRRRQKKQLRRQRKLSRRKQQLADEEKLSRRRQRRRRKERRRQHDSSQRNAKVLWDQISNGRKTTKNVFLRNEDEQNVLTEAEMKMATKKEAMADFQSDFLQAQARSNKRQTSASWQSYMS